MSVMLRHWVILLGAIGSLALPAVAEAQKSGGAAALQRDRYTAGEARTMREQGDVIPALRAISIVRQRYPSADILDAELEGGNNPRYVIRVLTRDGRRLDVVVDARTGRILYER